MKQVRWLLLGLFILGLCACGTGNTGANSNTNPNASQEFLNERSGTATADGTATTGGTTGMNQNPEIGIVQQVQGSTIVLLDPMTKQAKSVQLAANATITTQGIIQPSELQTGDKITAMGQQNGDQFQAQAVQVGEGGALGGGPVMIGLPNANGSGDQVVGPGANPSAPGGQTSLSGTVESVQGQQFVVKTADGKSVTVQLISGAQVRKQLPITPEQIEVGKLIVANGTLNGSTFEASSVEVLAAPPAP